MPLRLTVAGRIGVESDGLAVRANRIGAPARLALAYFACERHRPVTKDELAEVLWGEDLPGSWEQMLRGIVFRLRGLLAAAGLEPTAALATAGGAYQLRLPAEATLDVEEASAALDAARGALDAGYPATARNHALRSAEIAAREFAPGARGTWVERRQGELRETHLAALEIVARATLAEGDWPEAAAAAEEVIAKEPFRESAYSALIEAHARAGNRGEALRAYERCRRTLAEELGVDPSPPTEALYVAVLREDTPEVQVPRAAALPLPAALRTVPGSFMVGREAEADALAMALKRATVEGRQAVLVGGEAGVGKSSLIGQVARAAHEGGARVLFGRCDEELGVAYQPFAQALDNYVAHGPLGELRAHVAAHGEIVARLVPALARRLPDALPSPTTSDVEESRWRLFRAVDDLLTRAAKNMPVVLVLEDLHWAATPTLLLLRHLLSEPAAAAILIVGTYRNSEMAPEHPLASTLADLRRCPAVKRLTLEGLDEEAVAAYLLVAGVADDPELARDLRTRTAGNPFFIGELLRHGGGPTEAFGRGVPESVQEVVGRRVARLSESARHALVVSAVMGNEFDIDVVERLVPDPGSALDGLEECLGARLVHEVSASPGRHRFAHALVREAVYGQLSVSRRARLHRRVGETIEALSRADVVATLAHHFAEAASAGCATKAADYGLAAAQQAADRAAWEEAAAFLDRGLAALAAGSVDDMRRRFELLALKAQVLGSIATLDLSEVWQTSLHAFEAARESGSPEAMVRAAAAYNHPRQAGGEVGRRLCEEALAALGHDAAPELRSMLLVSLVNTRTFDHAAVDSMSEEALALARRSPNPDALVKARRVRADFLLGSPDTEALADLADEMRCDPSDSSRRAGLRALGQRFAVPVKLRLGDREGFDAEVEELDRVANELHSWLRREQVACCRVTQALLDGRFADVPHLAAAVAALHGWANQFVAAAGFEALLCWEQGRLHDLEWLPMPADTPAAFTRLTRAAQAIGAAESGRLDDARTRLDALMQELPGVGEKGAAIVSALLAEVAVALDDATAGRTLADRLQPYSGQVLVLGYGWVCLGPADRSLGLLAALLGDEEGAEGHFARALQLAKSLKSPPYIARTQCDYAAFLATRRRADDMRRAQDLLSAAAATAECLGMVGVRTRARALLARAEVR